MSIMYLFFFSKIHKEQKEKQRLEVIQNCVRCGRTGAVSGFVFTYIGISYCSHHQVSGSGSCPRHLEENFLFLFIKVIFIFIICNNYVN